MTIENHLLLQAEHRPIPKKNHKVKPMMFTVPELIIGHYTASGDLESTIKYVSNPNVFAFYHLLIDYDGKVVQLEHFNWEAWHAGKSRYGLRTNVNRFSIGIAMINDGQLTLEGDKCYTWYGEEVPRGQVFSTFDKKRNRTYWHKYTEEQIQSFMEVCLALKEAYPTIKDIRPHSYIAPKRKVDTGPAFPMEKIRYRVLGGLK